MNRTSRSVIASLLIALQAGTSYGRIYVVKPGDTLSEIVKTELGGPVYGKKGKLRKVLQWNPKINNANGISPAQEILLGPEKASPAPAIAAEPASAPVAPPAAAEPAASPAPAPAVAKSKAAKFGLDLDLLLGRTGIEATSEDKQYDTSPHSRLNRGVQLRAYYLLNPETAIGLEISVLNSRFAESDDGRLESSDKNLKHFALFYHQVMADRFHLELGLGSEQVYFLARSQTQDFELDPLFVDFFKLSLGYDVLAIENWRWNVALLGKIARAADGEAADAESGKTYGARSSVAYRLKDDLFINAGVEVERRAQDSTQATQRNTDLLGRVGVTLLF